MSDTPALSDLVKELRRSSTSQKEMGHAAPTFSEPHFFLLRDFVGCVDLLSIFNTKRCRRHCHFCNLPAKSTTQFVPSQALLEQYAFVLREVRYALDVIERLTISNEGSVLDAATFPLNALREIIVSTRHMPALREVVLETRLEFVGTDSLAELAQCNSRAQLFVLSGVETIDPDIRTRVLNKGETIDQLKRGLDALATCGASFTAYILFKPDPVMTDDEAISEADATTEFLIKECSLRNIPLSFRLNPVYVALGTPWSKRLDASYSPPRLSDVARLSNSLRSRGFSTYIGLSSEGLSGDDLTFRAREDFSPALYRACIKANHDSGYMVDL